MFQLKLFLFTLPVFLAFDAVWLGLVARGFYAEHLGHLMAPTPQWYAAIIFYIVDVVGILTFVVNPSLKEKSPRRACFFGGLFGLVTYATYDLTNLATLRDWPVVVTLVDLAWGVVITGLVSGISCWFGLKVLGFTKVSST